MSAMLARFYCDARAGRRLAGVGIRTRFASCRPASRQMSASARNALQRLHRIDIRVVVISLSDSTLSRISWLFCLCLSACLHRSVSIFVYLFLSLCLCV